jgi:hypothetical protein
MTIPALAETFDKQAADNQWAVETHGLTKRFGENVAVNGVELLVPRGCAFGYLGPNGAGPSSVPGGWPTGTPETVTRGAPPIAGVRDPGQRTAGSRPRHQGPVRTLRGARGHPSGV